VASNNEAQNRSKPKAGAGTALFFCLFHDEILRKKVIKKC
jgi:hypothetical protein